MSSGDEVTHIEVVLDESVQEKIPPKIAQENITPEHPRFKEVYGKLKESERKFEELSKTVETLSATNGIIDELKEHNSKLANALEKMMDGKEKDKVVDVIDQIQSELAALKTKRNIARRELEHENVDRLDDEIDELKDKLRNIKLTPKNEVPQYDVELAEVFQEFIDENDWFLKDDIMQAAAYTIDAKLLKDSKWRDPRKRYAEVKRIVEDRFNPNVRSKPKQQFSSVEGGSSQNSQGALTKSVTLSPAQVNAANALGISHDKYAKQLIAMGAL